MKAPVCTSPLAIKFLLKDQLVWTICFLLFFWFSFTSQVLGQTKQWDKTFGGTKYDGMETVISTPDGGYLLGGTSNSDKGGDKSENSRGGNDYWILKIDGFGQKQWDKTLGGNNDDYLRALVTTPDGGYLLGGSSNSGITGDKTAANFNDCNQYIYCDYELLILYLRIKQNCNWVPSYKPALWECLLKVKCTILPLLLTSS
jgi:hypothetical protein